MQMFLLVILCVLLGAIFYRKVQKKKQLEHIQSYRFSDLLQKKVIEKYPH